MTSAYDHPGSRRPKRRRLTPWALTLALTLSGAFFGVTARAPVDSSSQAAPQVLAQKAAKDQPSGGRLTFRVTQSGKVTSDSSDQITIIFSDQSWGGASPPYPLFGQDIIEEFSFSAADVSQQRPLTFTRVVRDVSFLDARYIRVINHGSEGWDGGTLSILLNGRPIIDTVQMKPRKGDPSKGLQNWNRDKWSSRTFWEAELQQIRR